MKTVEWLILIFSLSSIVGAEGLADYFVKDFNKRNQNTNFTCLIRATLFNYAAVGNEEDIEYAKEGEQKKARDSYKYIRFSPHGLDTVPEKKLEVADRRLEYLSIWVASIDPVEVLEGEEITGPIIVFGKESSALLFNELPQHLFYKLYKNGESAVFGLRKIPAEDVWKALSCMRVWRWNEQVLYGEGIEGDNRVLWRDVKTLGLPEKGTFYLIIDVGIDEKGEEKIFKRIEYQRERDEFYENLLKEEKAKRRKSQ